MNNRTQYTSPKILLSGFAVLILLILAGCETSSTTTQTATPPPAPMGSEARMTAEEEQIAAILEMRRSGQISQSEAMARIAALSGSSTTATVDAANTTSAPAVARTYPVESPSTARTTTTTITPAQRPSAPVTRTAPAPAAPTTTTVASSDDGAKVPAGFVSYKPKAELRGRLRSVGSDSMDRMMEAWEKTFARFHPSLRFSHEGRGSSTAIPTLIEGRSEFGPMSRPFKAEEVDKFAARYGYKPTIAPVAVDALGVFIHPDNPIADSGLTLQELDAIFGASQRQGYGSDIRTWGQLGLGGEWANAPIRVYGRNTASGTYGTFKDIVLLKGDFRDTYEPLPGSEEVVSAVAANKFAIGYSGIGYKTPNVETVPLATAPGQPYYEADGDNAANGDYPLARRLYVAINLDPVAGPTPLQEEFFRLLYSVEGQQIVIDDGYYPVSYRVAQNALSRIRAGGVGNTEEDLETPMSSSTQVASASTTAQPSTSAPAPMTPTAMASTDEAEAAITLAPYQPQLLLRGRLRSIGSDSMDGMIAAWERKFQEYHPRLRIAHEGRGSSTAIPALIEGRSEIGPMSREVKQSEIDRFIRKFGYPPVQTSVAGDALAIYVHPENPLLKTGINMQQLDAIFSSTRRRGASRDITTWGQLGLTGEWANAPIRVYSRNSASGTYGTFKDEVLQGGDFKGTNRELPSSEAVIEGVGSDKFAIGYSGIGFRNSTVRTIAVAENPGDTPVAPTRENAFSGLYPLSRALHITINHSPTGRKQNYLHQEFLRFVFSKEGQEIVRADGYFPVSETMAQKELVAIDAIPQWMQASN